MQQNNSSFVEDLGNGVYCERLLDGQILVFTLTSMTRVAVDTWADTQLRLLQAWPTDRPICILGDQSAMPQLTFSPYMKSRFMDFGAVSNGKSGRIALVLGKNFFPQIVNLLVRTLPMEKMQVRCFKQRDHALAWLKEIVVTAESVKVTN